MSDERKHLAPLDPGRVHLSDPEDLYYWCNELHCTQEELTQAVAAVGSHITAVRDHLHRMQGQTSTAARP
jgi:hypothetical protein